MLYTASFGMVNTTSSPASTGVLVAVGVAFGRVAVCAVVPMLTKALFGPSLTIRMEFPAIGRAAEVLAVLVTDIGRVFDVAENAIPVGIFYLTNVTIAEPCDNLRHYMTKFSHK